MTDQAGRWQAGKALLKPLYAAALLVYRHNQRWAADCMDARDDLGELLRIHVVACEQDHTAN